MLGLENKEKDSAVKSNTDAQQLLQNWLGERLI